MTALNWKVGPTMASICDGSGSQAHLLIFIAVRFRPTLVSSSLLPDQR